MKISLILLSCVCTMVNVNAANCADKKDFNWSLKQGISFNNWWKLQHPETSECLTRNDLGKKKLDGAMWQKDNTLYFQQTGGVGKRTELRGYSVQGGYGKLVARVVPRKALGGRITTVGQLFEGKPIVRVEINDGRVYAVVRQDKNSENAKYYPDRGTGQRVNLDEAFDYTLILKSNGDQVEVRIPGLTRTFTLRNYKKEYPYFKAGCYVNNESKAGCKVSFERLQMSR